MHAWGVKRMLPGKMKGKFWGITAAPIQSTGDPERRWQLLSYFRGIKGLNTIKARKFALKWSEVTMPVRIGKEVVLKERIRLVRWESVWIPEKNVNLDTKINGNTEITMAWMPLISLNTRNDFNLNIGRYEIINIGLNTEGLAWMPQVASTWTSETSSIWTSENWPECHFGLNTGNLHACRHW